MASNLHSYMSLASSYVYVPNNHVDKQEEINEDDYKQMCYDYESLDNENRHNHIILLKAFILLGLQL